MEYKKFLTLLKAKIEAVIGEPRSIRVTIYPHDSVSRDWSDTVPGFTRSDTFEVNGNVKFPSPELWIDTFQNFDKFKCIASLNVYTIERIPDDEGYIFNVKRHACCSLRVDMLVKEEERRQEELEKCAYEAVMPLVNDLFSEEKGYEVDTVKIPARTMIGPGRKQKEE